MNKDLIEIIKKLKGNVLAAGIYDNVILDKLYKNADITELFTLVKTKTFKNNGKNNVKIKKLKKKFKDKLDYAVCDVNGMGLSLRKFVKISYSIVLKDVIFYGVYDEYDVDKMIKRFERYNAKCTKKMYKDSFILEVSMKNIKMKHVFINDIKDLLIDIIDAIGNLLIT